MRLARPTRIGFVAGSILGGASCALPPEQPSWHDQLVPDSPCYRVNLLDGLSEDSSAEVHDLFACLDHQDHLRPFVPVDDALDTRTRSGDPAAVELARAINGLPEAGLDPWTAAEVAVDLLTRDDAPLADLLDVSLELTYGEPYDVVRSTVVLTDPIALRGGALVPLGPVLPAIATAALDDDLVAVDWLGATLASPDTARAMKTAAALARSTDPAVSRPTRALVGDVGDAILRARSPQNDLWRDSSGDSLRDVATVLVAGHRGGTATLDAVAPEIEVILGDAVVRRQVEDALVSLHDQGVLTGVADDLAWLVSVDGQGGTLVPGELSALDHFARLVHDTNRPMRCSIDLVVTTLNVDLGNLAVSLLGVIADLGPDGAQTGAGILGDVLGWDLSGFVLDSVASSGVCSALTPDVVESLDAIGLLYDDRATDATVLFVEVLRALQTGQGDRIPELAGVFSDLHATGAMPALDEAVRDLHDAPLVDDVVDLVPILVDPSPYVGDLGDPVDLQDLLVGAHDLFVRTDGRTDWSRLAPVARAAITADGTWEALGHLGPVLDDPGSKSRDLVDLVGRLLDADPDAALPAQLGALLSTRAVTEPALRALEQPELSDELVRVQPLPGQREVPLAFGARLIVDGTLDDLLSIVDTLLGSLTVQEE